MKTAFRQISSDIKLQRYEDVLKGEKMKVYGLVGKSGTGKSYQSMNVCRDRNIEGIIDDGLFIWKNAIQAGHSAKRDANKVSAIKTAIFQNEENRREVAERIREVEPKSLLVLGTSEAMIAKICRRLELPEVSEMIRIEDVASQDAITTALRQRKELGKHVIPVPTFEIKPQFSGYFMAPLRILRGKNDRQGAQQEKSVVRPTYSYLGEFTISDRTVTELILYTCRLCEAVAEVTKCSVKSRPDGVKINISTIFYYDPGLQIRARELRELVAGEVEKMTAFNIIAVDIEIRGLRPKNGDGEGWRRRAQGRTGARA